MRTGLKIMASVTLAVVILAGIILGGWAAGWWFRTQNTVREARLYQHQYGRQQALLDDFARKVGSVADITSQLADRTVGPTQAMVLRAQRLATARDACRDVAQLNSASDELAADQQVWAQRNCANGDVSLTSPLREG